MVSSVVVELVDENPLKRILDILDSFKGTLKSFEFVRWNKFDKADESLEGI